MNISRLAMLCSTFVIGSLLSEVASGQFGDVDPFGGPAFPVQQDEAKPDDPVDEGPIIEIDRSGVDVPPNVMRLTLLDGSIITGELNQDSVTVSTDFGDLQVPIHRIRRLRPGLRSYPALRARVDGLIADLGAADFEDRETAQKALIAYGIKVQKILAATTDDGNAERKRRLDEIKKALESLIEENMMLGDEATDRPWEEFDVVETDAFNISGAIELDKLQISSRYGELSISMADLQMADRLFGGKDSTSRGLVVDATNLVQRGFKSSQLRIERGDKITVVAEGQIVMSPWGSNQMANPDGNAYYGMYQQFPGGSLLATIGGGSGKEFLVGKRKTWIAESSGVLKFAISMQNDYSGGGYNFPGQYTLRIKVEPQ